MKHLNPEQIKQLHEIKQTGVYDRRRRHGKRSRGSENGCRRETLYDVLYTGLMMYETTSFKAKHIIHEYLQHGHSDKRYTRYGDIPLTTGEIINAIKHGQKHGLLERHTDARVGVWYLTSKALTKKGENWPEAVRK